MFKLASAHFTTAIPDDALLPLPAPLVLVGDLADCGSRACDRVFVVAADGVSQDEVLVLVAEHLREEKGWHDVSGDAADRWFSRDHLSLRIGRFASGWRYTPGSEKRRSGPISTGLT